LLLISLPSLHLQVFDHPSVTAISSYISALGGAAVSAVATVISDDGDESDDAFSLQEDQLSTAGSLQIARSPAVDSSTLQTPLIGISSMASKTAANNAVMHLPGVDASNRVPFNRWELEKQEQVSWELSCHRNSLYGRLYCNC
jgi:hypothetical protein